MDMNPLQKQSDVIVNDIKELLAQPEQEPVDWQYRTTPNWREQWSKWESCGKNIYENYKRVPQLHDWVYETRELYTSPPKREPLSKEQYMKFFADTYNSVSPITDFVRLIEKAHGIGVENE